MTRARSVAHGMLWNYAGAAQNTLVQLGYTALTARLVEPAAFGAYAIATGVIGVFGYFANGGVSACLLRAEQLTRPLTHLALRTTAVTGACCFLAAQPAALIVGGFWDIDGLVPLVRLLSVQFLVLPMTLAATAALRRCGRAAQVVRIELAAQVGGCGVALALLAVGWNPYALAAAAPVSSIILLTGSVRLLAAQELPRGPRPQLADLLGPSTFFAGHSLVQYGCNTAPLWLAGALLGPATAGHYSRASLFTGLPLTMLAQGIHRAAAPALAESRGGRAVHDTLCAASAMGLIGFGALAGVGPAALTLLLGPGWETAGRLVPVLAAGAAVSLVASVGDSVNQVRHDPRSLVSSQLCAALSIVCTLAAAALYGSLWVLAAAAVTGPVAAHAAQLLRWDVRMSASVLRAHAVHATAGSALFVVGHTAVSYGLYPGLMVALPLLASGVLFRDRLPAYALARRHGLIRSGKGDICAQHATSGSADQQ